MTQSSYIARVVLNVNHTLIKPGDTVELTDAQAADLLAVGAVTSQAALDAAAQTQQAEVTHQFAKTATAVQAAAPVTAKAPVAAKAALAAAK